MRILKKRTIIIIGIIVAGILILTLLIFWVWRFLFPPALPEAPAFFPGAYVCDVGNEFCRIRDTVIIRRLTPGGLNYLISRKSAFVRIRQGVAGSPEYQQDVWEGYYDPERQTLTAAGRPDTIRYLPEANRIHKNFLIYEKIE
jgi:hypothetical protein